MKQKKHSFLYQLFFCLIAFAPLFSQAQISGLFKKKTKVKITPRASRLSIDERSVFLQDGFVSAGGNWIVYSDRSGNVTYRKPGGELQLKKLAFMDACYVIGSSGDFLELVKYKPDLIKDPKSRSIDPKSVEYLGWIKKSNLLLWNTAVKDAATKFDVKALVAFRSRSIFSQLPKLVMSDSVLLFGQPSLKDPLKKCSPGDIVYVFKQSSDGRQFLIGKTSQFTNDNAKDIIIGWLSKDLLKLWGERSYFTQNKNKLLLSDSTNRLFFLKDTGTIQKNTSFFVYNAIENGTPNIVENIFPVQKIEKKDDSTSFIKTGILADVLDRNDNYVLNILGHKLYYSQYKLIETDQSKMNIVFVMDGGIENGQYISNVMAILQNLQYKFETSQKFRQFKFGAVVYKDNLGGDCAKIAKQMPLTYDYSALLNFLAEKQSEVAKCNDASSSQAVFSGLNTAAKLLKSVENESNIIVLIGGGGNNAIGNDWNDLVSTLSYVKARLLVFQTHSISDPSYNDFVIQGKDIVTKTAANISEFKKEKLVDFANVVPSESFSLVAGDSGIYYLDYPRQSMMQGYVMFPEKGKVMQPSLLERGIDSLVDKISTDNKLVTSSLIKYFSTIGIRNTRINEAFQCFYPEYGNSYLPADFLKKYQFANRPYYLPASVNYAANKPDSINNVQFGLLVSESEYAAVIRSLLIIAGDDDYSLRNEKSIYAHLKKVYKQYVNDNKISLRRRQIRRSTLAQMLKVMTGYKTANTDWNKTTLKMVKKTKYAKRETGLDFIRGCYYKAKWLEENENDNDIKITNNEQTYYWLTSDLLPGSHIQLPENNIQNSNQ